MQYYRFQKTDKLEKESYSEFLSDIYFMIGGEENEWDSLDSGQKEELIEEVLDRWSFAIILWWDKHRDKFQDENYEDEVEFLINLLSAKTEESLWEFMMEHKLDGLFAVKVEDHPDKDELIKASVNPELGLHNDHLLVIEGVDIAYFGKNYGYLINPDKIVSVEKLPSTYIK